VLSRDEQDGRELVGPVTSTEEAELSYRPLLVVWIMESCQTVQPVSIGLQLRAWNSKPEAQDGHGGAQLTWPRCVQGCAEQSTTHSCLTKWQCRVRSSLYTTPSLTLTASIPNKMSICTRQLTC